MSTPDAPRLQPVYDCKKYHNALPTAGSLPNCHPASMAHASVPTEQRRKSGLSEGMEMLKT